MLPFLPPPQQLLDVEGQRVVTNTLQKCSRQSGIMAAQYHEPSSINGRGEATQQKTYENHNRLFSQNWPHLDLSIQNEAYAIRRAAA
jgi:hypothetical protein